MSRRRWWQPVLVAVVGGAMLWGALRVHRSLGPDAAFTVVAIGDMVCGDDSGVLPCRQMATSDLAIQLKPRAVVVAGDTQYEKGVYEQFVKHYAPSWGRLKSITYPSVGDHEYLTPGAAGYFDYFNGIGKPAGRAGERDKGYYSFDLGAWHFIALNYNCDATGGCGPGSPQEQWLRADLAANHSQCTMAYWHRPYVGSGQHGSHPEYQPFWQALYNHGVEVVINGHDHDYERFAPLTPSLEPDPAHGIRQFVIGTGGQRLEKLGASGRQPHSEVFYTDDFGVLAFTLHSAGYDWRFLSTAGAVVDSGTGSCHAPAAPPAPAPSAAQPATP